MFFYAHRGKLAPNSALIACSANPVPEIAHLETDSNTSQLTYRARMCCFIAIHHWAL